MSDGSDCRQHNYNIFYKNYPMKVGTCIIMKMNIAKTNMMVVENIPINVNTVLIENIPINVNTVLIENIPINVNTVLIENVEGCLYLGQHNTLRKKNRDKVIQPCHIHEETGVQFLRAVSYDIILWCRDLDTHQQAQNKLAAAPTQYHIQGQIEVVQPPVSDVYCYACLDIKCPLQSGMDRR